MEMNDDGMTKTSSHRAGEEAQSPLLFLASRSIILLFFK
jgi:hypothetical protein